MDKMLPLGMMPKLAQEIGLDTMSSKERLRVHVAALYLSDEQKRLLNLLQRNEQRFKIFFLTLPRRFSQKML
jgi:hypothetical protein